MSATTRSGGSTPSAVVKRCSGSSASSLPRTKRSTPHNRIVAMPASEDNTVDRSYEHGLSLARSGSFFAAHEAFEDAWRACADTARDFFQGLVHGGFSASPGDRGKPVAQERQRVKALHRLARF